MALSTKSLLSIALLGIFVTSVTQTVQAVLVTSNGTTLFSDDFEDNANINGGASRLGDTLESAEKFGPGPPAVVGSWSTGNYGTGGTYRVKNSGPDAFQGNQWAEIDRIGDPRLLAVFDGEAQSAGTPLHFESMVYIKSGGDEANIGFQGTTDKDDFGLFISGRRNESMQYWDSGSGWTDATTGGGNPMTYTQDAWQKWEWDYTVGDEEFIFCVDSVCSDPVDVKDPSTLPRMVTFSMNSNIGPGFGIDRAGAPTPPSPEKTWRGNVSGNWATSSHWTGGIPDGDPIEEVAVFGDAITQSRVVYTEADVTVKGMQFANNNAYVIAGAGTINIADSAAAASVAVAIGNHEIQAKVSLQSDVNMVLGTNTSLTLNNQLDLGGNTLTKMGGGTLSINNILSTGSDGTINCQGGNCAGSGTVGGNLSNSAVVAPGNSPGILSVDGNYTQTASGTLEIELASNGGVAGTDHDRLAVTLAASLDGTLDLQLDGGYSPTIGDSFAGIVTAGALSGQFATTSNVVIDGRRGVAVTYTGTAVDAQIGLRGNTDIATGDIDVDTSDLTISIINFTSAGGAGKTWADGDTDGDGDVDTSDLTTSIINFTSALSANSAAVPEPAGLLLAMLGMLGMLGIRQHNPVTR